jgi:hypothetical protein
VLSGTAKYSGSTITVPTAALSVSTTNQTLLTCASNSFADINTATTAKTITPTGTPSVQAFSPFAPTAAYSTTTVGGSGYFDGTGDYLDAGTNAALSFGTGDFTVEAWIYRTTSATYPIYTNGTTATGSFTLYVVSNKLQCDYYGGTSLTGATTIALNSWNHVAVIRSGSTLSLYLNGIRDATTTTSSNNTSSNGVIGRDWTNGTNYANGYTSSLRVVKGSAVYSGTSYTIPTAPLTAITNTSLLTNFTNAGIFDAAAKNDLETVGNAQVSTTQAKFGTTSIAFDGTGDYLYIPQSNNPQNLNWELYKGDFTIEFWFRANSVTGIQGIIAKFNGNASARTDIQYLITLNGSSLNCNLYQSTTNNDITFTSSISTNTWYHVALVRSGTSVYAYLDGTRNATIRTITGDLNSGTTWPLQIGRYTEASANSDFNGYIDELRITKFARYSGSTITVPTAAFALQ